MFVDDTGARLDLATVRSLWLGHRKTVTPRMRSFSLLPCTERGGREEELIVALSDGRFAAFSARISCLPREQDLSAVAPVNLYRPSHSTAATAGPLFSVGHV